MADVICLWCRDRLEPGHDVDSCRAAILAYEAHDVCALEAPTVAVGLVPLPPTGRIIRGVRS